MFRKEKNAKHYLRKGVFKMRKISAILSVLCIIAVFVGCSASSGQPQKSDYNAAGETTANRDEEWGLNETAEFKNLKVTATEIKESGGSEFFHAKAGNAFVGIKFEIENISDETQAMSSLLLFDAYADDVKYQYSFSANAEFGDGTLDGEVSPGKKLVGWYAVEVAEDWQKLELEVKADWLSNSKAKFVFNK